MPDYSVGDVVNGHVWTGTTWVPAPPPPPRPGQKLKPYKPPTPVSVWRTFGTLSIMFAVILLVAGLGFLFGYQINDLGRDLQADAGSSPNDPAASIADFVQGSTYRWPSLIGAALLGVVGFLCLRKAPKAPTTESASSAAP